MRGNESAAFVMVKAGYDSWLLDLRGNKYSRKHLSLNPDVDKEYWNFTFHEMG